MAIEKADSNDLRFKNPGHLLFVVFAFIFWGVGLLDLLGHQSAEPDVFGLYSLPFLALILIYASFIVVWILLFANSNLLMLAVDTIRVIQNKIWFALPVFAGQLLVFWLILEWDRWTRLPGLQVAAFGLMLMSIAILLFSNWDTLNWKNQRWRKIVVYLLLMLIAFELIIQVVAFLGILPGSYAIGGDFAPYERIYYTEEGFHNGFANRYGWTFPDATLDDDNMRILIVGGSDVQALGVMPEKQFSALLSNQINLNATGENVTEVVSIGMPGFGLTPFIYDLIISELPNVMRVDEIVVMFHLGNDFQSPAPESNAITYNVDETGAATVQPPDARLRHDLTHYYLRGFQSFQLVETIRSNYLTPKVLASFVRGLNETTVVDNVSAASDAFSISRMTSYVSDSYSLTEQDHAGIRETASVEIPGGNDFMFATGNSEAKAEAIAIAGNVLETAQETTLAHGITLKIVTIPAFPQAFFDEFQNGDWEPTFGHVDLFSAEESLIDIAQANGIPILPMGQYMAADGASANEINQFFYPNGRGGLTPEGHAYFADVIYTCFYAETVKVRCPALEN